jgi:hypothetical protein
MTVEETTEALKHAAIAQQNDMFRQAVCGTLPENCTGLSIGKGQLVYTQGIAALDQDAFKALLRALGSFDDFTQDNDPSCEHDFGTILITANGTEQRVFWKFDLYDNDLVGGSPDPADLNVTTRVLTLMLAHEY